MIYVPDLQNYECFVVQSSDVIRAYETVPRLNSTVNYRDYYMNSHYVFKDGVQTFSNYSNNIPVCLSSSDVTDVIGYRNDFADICIITLILCGVAWFLVSKVVKTLFKGRKLY